MSNLLIACCDVRMTKLLLLVFKNISSQSISNHFLSSIFNTLKRSFEIKSCKAKSFPLKIRSVCDAFMAAVKISLCLLCNHFLFSFQIVTPKWDFLYFRMMKIEIRTQRM